MTNSRDLILKLKEVKERDKLSLGEIEARTEQNGEHVSKTTLSRVFAEGSEDITFRFEGTLKPIANALLDIETIEETDDLDTQAMKVMLQIKAKRIRELEVELAQEKIKHHEKIDKEREQFHKSLDFLKEQVALKDKRIDQLMNANDKLLDEFMNCPKRNCK